MSSTVHAVELGLRLRARRENLGLTAAAVGKQTGIGGNNMSWIESAKRRLTNGKLRELAEVYELGDAEFAELETLRRAAEEHSWWDDYQRLYRDEFLRFIGLEAGSSASTEYSPETIPGMLQTPEYARAMMRGGSALMRPIDIGLKVEARLARQSLLEPDSSHRYTVLIGQTALQQAVGGPEVLASQLRQIAALGARGRDRINIHVMPYRAGAHPVIGGGLKTLSFASSWLTDVAWQEAVIAGSLIERPHVVDELRAAVEAAIEQAADPDESLEMINDTRVKLEA